MITTALDPGLEYAVAVGQDGRLAACYFRPPFRPCSAAIQADRVVVEFPKYYEGGAPPNKVIELAFNAGVQAGCLGATPDNMPTRVPTVALSKAEIERRVMKILTPSEAAMLLRELARTPKAMRNNVVDAVRHLLVDARRMLP